MMIKEWWKESKDYPQYFVSNYGRVFSTRTMRLMKPLKRKDGYISYGFTINGKTKSKLGHQLVLESFVGNCPEGHVGHHKNSLKSDNRLHNLEWVTCSQNVCEAWKIR